jgi:hypothetical protein
MEPGDYVDSLLRHFTSFDVWDCWVAEQKGTRNRSLNGRVHGVVGPTLIQSFIYDYLTSYYTDYSDGRMNG